MEHRGRPDRKNYEMMIIKTGMNRQEARFWEQLFISAYSIKYLDNARREISVGNLEGFRNYTHKAADIIGGGVEEDFYLLMFER